jgi:hypothetical protein
VQVFKKIIDNRVAQRQVERRAELYRKLLRHEARIGGQLFGPVRPGGRREFFCLDERTWVWHEEWVDQTGQRQIKTTRYDVRPDVILKSQNGQYQKISREEADRLVEASKIYRDRVKAELYSGVH